MVFHPITTDEIYANLRSRIIDRTEDLTNFSERSVNHTLARNGFAEYWRLFEHGMLAIQLSGWVEFAGGPIDRDDLVTAGLQQPDKVDLALLNFFMDDTDLDALAAQNGITRDPGSVAVGEVLFSVSNRRVEVPAGTVVQTESNAADQVLRYLTTRRVVAGEDEGSVIAPIEAEFRGEEYNIGSGLIVELSESPSGVNSVTNIESTYDGEEPEDNDSLRVRVQNALTRNSGGGTVHGIAGAIEQNVDGVEEGDVLIEEHDNPNPETDPRDRDSPYGDVIVDGGDEQEVLDAIERYRPACIAHFLVRPTTHTMTVEIEVSGSSIGIDTVENEVIQYISDLKLGDNLNRANLYQLILNSDPDIVNVTGLDVRSDISGEILGDLLIDPDEVAVPGIVTVSVTDPTP